MDLSPTPIKSPLTDGIEIFDCSAKNQKWVKKIDTYFDTKNSLALTKTLTKLASKSGNIHDWKVYYILNRRAQQDAPEDYIASGGSHNLTKNPPNILNYILHKGTDRQKIMAARAFDLKTTQGVSSFDIYMMDMDILLKWRAQGHSAFDGQLFDTIAHDGTIEDLDRAVELGAKPSPHNSLALKRAIKHQDIIFIKRMLDHGFNVFANESAALTEAKGRGKFDVVALFRKHIKLINGEPIERDISDLPEWEKIDNATIVKNKPLPHDTGVIKEYFDFAARRLRSVQEDSRGIHPLFSENFADIERQNIIETARDELIKRNGTPPVSEQTRSPAVSLQIAKATPSKR